MEKSLRLQNADLLTEYNLLEADLARPKVKEADFRGKAKHLEYRAREHQPAMLCTLVMTDNVDCKGVARYPVGIMPVHGPGNRRDAGRRTRPPLLHHLDRLRPDASARTSRWPTCPGRYCQEGRKLAVEYFGETYPVEVAGGRLQAALRSGEPQAAQLIAALARELSAGCRSRTGLRQRR